MIVIGTGPGRLRGRDPRRPARPEDGGRREGRGRRALPQLRLHPGEDAAAHGRALRRGQERRGARRSRSRTPASTGRRCTSAARASRETLTGGVAGLFKKNKIDLIEGEASLTDDGNVKVGDETYETKNVILATGSVALPIPGVEFGDRVLDTWGAWSLPELPKSIAVVGAGASGAEIASAYGRFGTEVKLIEMLDQILPAEDKDVARVVERTFKKQGIEISPAPRSRTSRPARSRSSSATATRRPRSTTCASPAAAAPTSRRSTSTRPASRSTTTARSRSTTARRPRPTASTRSATSSPGPALAHKASEEGIVAAEAIAGEKVHPIDLDAIPGATFCHPQVASVGMTEAAGQGGRPRGQGRQVQARRRRRRPRLRRPRRHGQARRRHEVRRDPRRPHRRQPRLRHDRRAGRDQGRSRAATRSSRGSSTRTRRSPRRSPRPPARRRLGHPRLAAESATVPIARAAET